MLTKFLLLLFAFQYDALASLDLERNLMKTWRNNLFYGFRGIKYAEPPIGDLRFKAPIPIKTWHNNITQLFEQILDKDGSDCPSPTTAQPFNEDCLFLNVYTKDLNPNELRPVVVFIHPGGLYILSGSSKNFGPEYLLEHDIVLVTFNYRLAHFGFTSLGTDDATGNAGFKDQVLVLKWVQDHIHNFGGDKNLVTLMGDSAGALSISLHLVSPMSTNLFHRAFLMSGSMLPQIEVLPKEQSFLVNKLARNLNCDESTVPFDCVKLAHTNDITLSLRKMFDFGHDNPVYRWLPVIESKNADKKNFLDQNPIELLRTGNMNQVPILMSVTKHEVSMSAMYLFEHRHLLEQFINNFSYVAPICFAYEQNEFISSTLKAEYFTYDFEDQNHFADLFDEVAQCFSDGCINFPMYRLAQLVQQFTDVYIMKFNFYGSFTGFKCNWSLDQSLCNAIKSKRIVEHCDDLQYLFTSESSPRIADDSSIESEIVKKYTNLIYSFAKHGYPDYGPEIDVNKTKYNDNETYIIFDKNFQIDNVPFKTIDIWNRLFPLKIQNLVVSSDGGD